MIERYRRWLWAEIEAGRIDPAELAALHGKLERARELLDKFLADRLRDEKGAS